MDGLILFSHGALICGSGQALNDHAGRLRLTGKYAAVEAGYLNYSKPLFQEAVARIAQAGITRIVVVPYFLVPGVFVTSDLPRAIDAARKEWPDLTFVIADPIGFDEALADIILELADGAKKPKRWRDEIRRAAYHCEQNPNCPLYGSPSCPSTSSLASIEPAAGARA